MLGPPDVGSLCGQEPVVLETEAGEGVGRGDESGGGAAEGEGAVAGEVVVDGDEGGAEEAVVVDGVETSEGAGLEVRPVRRWTRGRRDLLGRPRP
jgi:hypothetical protein